MQLFVRAQQQHVVDCEENETVGGLKVRVFLVCNWGVGSFQYLLMIIIMCLKGRYIACN